MSSIYSFNIVPVYVLIIMKCSYKSCNRIAICINSSSYIIGLARTHKYNALSKFMYIVCLQALMNVGYAHTI